MKIVKADGTEEEFKPSKLRTSLKKAGADKTEVDTIVRKIESEMLPGMTTQIIYRKAFALLRESSTPLAAKYSLRRALYSLGPTGFPFEDFLARLFEAEGYKTKTRIHIRGKCAIHEIDIAAYTKEHSFVAEAKFHSRPGIKSDLQDAMYSYARFLDLRDHPSCRDDVCGIDAVTLVTNTKFTKTARDYGKCVGIELLSWDYPAQNSLQTRVEQVGVFPITALTTLPNSFKARLLEGGVILCRDILQKPVILEHYGLDYKKAQQVIQEASSLCVSKKA